MQRQRHGLVPIASALVDLPGPIQAIRKTPSPARRGLHRSRSGEPACRGPAKRTPIWASWRETMALCSLPRTNPGNRLLYKRVNGPFTLYMQAGPEYKLPFGHLPRLLMAWISTEAVQTQNRVLVLGKSLSDFMRALGIYSSDGKAYTRLRNQMERLFKRPCPVGLRR